MQPHNPIEHVVIIVMENHSFDNYFGTYPGVNGSPARSIFHHLAAASPATGHLQFVFAPQAPLASAGWCTSLQVLQGPGMYLKLFLGELWQTYI